MELIFKNSNKKTSDFAEVDGESTNELPWKGIHENYKQYQAPHCGGKFNG